ncbi:ribosome biogenesis protein tsr1 [Halocaridina rubra]|uniref:Pre-rRNA-processing protein TSR1 homolog n=1 Tax=Halocaridina rubra TaxID=373956 RepID=A0AAN8WIT5_HALRR
MLATRGEILLEVLQNVIYLIIKVIMAMSSVHRPSALKQQNKKHNVLGHRTKGALTKAFKGRVSIKTVSKKPNRKLSKEERRNQIRQIRSVKRELTVARKRSLGTSGSPPFLVTVIPLSPNINPRTTLRTLTTCDPTAVTTISPQGITHISCSRFKQRFAFVIPPVNDLYAILDSLKVSDTVLFIWPSEEELGDAAEMLLSSILAQGLPAPVHVLSSLDDMSVKKRHRAKQNVQKEIEALFPDTPKLHCIERDQDGILVLRQIGAQKQRSIFYRDNRAHILAEKVEFVGEGSTGTLQIHGYVRGKALSPNDLIHIPGWGEYQMSHIDTAGDPHPLDRNRRNMDEDDIHLFEKADPEHQESLISTNEVDPMEGEQTWPTEEDIKEAESMMATKTRTKIVPKGTSSYQAAWILEEDGESGNGESEEDVESCGKNSDFTPVDNVSQDGIEYGDEDEEDEYESMSVTDAGDVNYDEKVDYAAEMDAYKKMQAAREDAMFPDELDTPQNIPARVRFQKFRGLQSFRTSTWDYNENLPVDYSRVFQFQNFTHTKKRILKEEKDGAPPGWYVIVHIKDVPRHLYDIHITSHSPLVAFGLLPHEQKMSVVNVVIKSHPVGHYRAIKAKERLIFHIGFRRFANQPIFSEHSSGNKHKFARFFHPGSTVVATMFAPITYPPASVMVFRERPDGAQDLVATGSMLSVDPRRMVIKRVVLSGYPFKINKKSAVVRFLFFNREDVLWFKPVELRTKWGRRGHIKEPLGTHGHVKCHFDGKLKSQDTVLLNLYKRMFPKWTFDPYVARPPPLYTFRSSHEEDEDLNHRGSESPSIPEKKKVKIAEESFPDERKEKVVTFLSSR